MFATDVRYDSISNYSWKGEIPERDGWLSIVKKPEGTSGILFYDTLLFVIDAINDTLSLLTTHEVVDTVINCNDTVFTELIDVTCAGNECAAQINILALIPPDASTWFVNETKAKMFIASLEETLNSAFKRSNISHRVKVEYEYIDYTYTQSTTGNEPIAMAANSNLIALRESRKADLVILLTNHQFSDNDLGFVAAIGPSTSNAYGIVQLKYASSPYYVFVHEIGHLLGCHHHHAHPRDWSDCPYAWEIVPNWFYTVMEPHAPELKNGYHKHRLLNFSDPLIKFAGYKTGSDGSNNEFPSNNAGRIRETGCEVANFFGGSDLVVVINGDNSLCDDPEVYTANVTPPPLGQPGQPPYIYEWRWNLDGIFTPQNPGTLLNETSYQISVPDPDLGDCSFFFLHVKVSSNGVTGHATKRIATSCEPCPYPYFDSRSNKSISKKEHYDNNLLVFPNPLTSNITLNWSSNTEELINFELYSSEGKFLKSYNYFSHLGFNLFDINLNENFSNGYYLIRMMTSLSSTNYKIIISK